ncbi:MAG: sigma-70 family RNA polymerase sigma factor [Pirellulales bacterium]
MSDATVGIERCIVQIKAGDTSVRGELINYAYDRLLRMTRKMKNQYERVGRWEQTDDILQNASLRLYQALHQVQITDMRHFFRLAALQIRRELIDMCRHYHGPHGLGANHFTQRRPAAAEGSVQPQLYDRAEVSQDPRRMQEWAEFHVAVQELPQREREVVDLLWYHEMNQEEAAKLLDVSPRHVKRLWRSAKLLLHQRLHGEIPGE